jgi:hypothetical protein
MDDGCANPTLGSALYTTVWKCFQTGTASVLPAFVSRRREHHSAHTVVNCNTQTRRPHQLQQPAAKSLVAANQVPTTQPNALYNQSGWTRAIAEAGQAQTRIVPQSCLALKVPKYPEVRAHLSCEDDHADNESDSSYDSGSDESEAGHESEEGDDDDDDDDEDDEDDEDSASSESEEAFESDRDNEQDEEGEQEPTDSESTMSDEDQLL